MAKRGLKQPKFFTTYHLWNKWLLRFDEKDDRPVLVVEDHKENVLYADVSKVWRNQAAVSVMLRREDGGSQIVLLDPDLEIPPAAK